MGGREGGLGRALFALGGVLIVVWSCHGTQRDIPLQQTQLPNLGASSSGAADAAASSGSAGAGAVLGEACDDPASCASGYCVDGVCCDRACTELCATCAAPGSEGTCSPAASDPECTQIGCPGATDCRRRDDTGLALNCDAIGKCKSNVTCAPIDAAAGTPCVNATGTCDGAGACTVTGKASLGGTCSADTDCAEGHCLAGAGGARICCDAACDGTCQQCSAQGRCEAAPATDQRCAAVVCPRDNPCFDYPDSLTDNLCRGFGECRTVQDCVPTALLPASSCDCDASGACTLRRGVACNDDSQCGAGAKCVAGLDGQAICCAVACGTGLFCSPDGSSCIECNDTNITCDGTTAVTCNAGTHNRQDCPNGCTPGTGCNAQAPVGFSCASATCAGSAVCQTDASGQQRCCVRDCAAESKQCAVDGSCVCPPGQATTGTSCALQQGDPCGTGQAQCGTGLTCVDGVCCNEACTGTCESCNLPGSVGTCAVDSSNSSSCPAGEQCVGRGDCRHGLSQTCTQGSDCVSANCEAVPGASGHEVCCANACTSPNGFCSSDGTRCVQCQADQDCPNGCNVAQGTCNPLRGAGQTCNVAQQCSTGVCLPDVADSRTNRCCPACAAGQLCSAQGACQNPPLGAGGRCQTDGQCNTGLFCRDGVCCSSACDGPCESCSSSGTCNIPLSTDPQRCGSVTCAQTSNACRTVTAPAVGQCAGLNQCATAAQCTVQLRPAQTPCGGSNQCDGAGNCAPPALAANGQLCTAGNQCSSNSCQLSAANPSQRICCPQQCGAGQFCITTGAGSCVDCVSNGDCNGNPCIGGVCQFTAEGSPCTTSSQCASGLSCVPFFSDPDGDGFAVAGASTQTFCATSRTGVANFTQTQPRSATTTDCLEGNGDVHPGQTQFFSTPIAGATLAFDYNCDGIERASLATYNRLADCTDSSIADCGSRSGYVPAGVTISMGTGIPPCGQSASFQGCNLFDANGSNAGPGPFNVCAPSGGGPALRSPCR